VVWESSCGEQSLRASGVAVSCSRKTFIKDFPKGSVVVFYGEESRGVSFGSNIESSAPFSPSRLEFEYENTDGVDVITRISYAGVVLENSGLETTPNASGAQWHIVQANKRVKSFCCSSCSDI